MDPYRLGGIGGGLEVCRIDAIEGCKYVHCWAVGGVLGWKCSLSERKLS